MKLELELFPAAAGASVKKTFAAWGIGDEFSGALRDQAADELNLTLPGRAILPALFTSNDRVQVTIDAQPFFSGYVPDEEPRTGDGQSNQSAVMISGPWWYFENLVFKQKRSILTSLDIDGNPVFTDYFLTQFTLNLPLVPNYVGGGNATLVYAPTLLSSRDQIAEILDWAIADGAHIAYDAADILSIPVKPADVLNVTCADAIRRQLELVDAVAWFDHTQDPPKFHAARRKDLPAYLRTLGNKREVQGFRPLKKRNTKVPYVQLDFQEPYSVGSINTVITQTAVYPDPRPAKNLKALITTVPLRSISGTVHTKYIKTEPIDPTDLDWWKRRKPELDINHNPKADIEYADLELLPDTQVRSLNFGTPDLDNMIVDGGYCDFMGGLIGDEQIFIQAKYHRKFDTYRKGTRVSAHTWRAHAKTTTLNFPAGVNFSFTEYSSLGESITEFLALPKIIYDDLSADQWEGVIPLFETKYSGEVVLGKTLNIAGGLPEWAAMAALQREIGFTIKPGGCFYSVKLGPNKNLTAGNLADLLRAERTNYVLAIGFNPAGSTKVRLSRHHASGMHSSAEPALAEKTVLEPIDAADPEAVTYPTAAGEVNFNAGAGKPALQIRMVDAAGAKIPHFGDFALHIRAAAKLYDGAGVEDGGTTVDGVKIGGAIDSDGKAHTIECWQLTTCEDDGTGTDTTANFTRLFVCSDRFKISGQ